MTTHSTVPLGQVRPRAAAKSDRFYYTAAGAIMLMVVLLGFQHFYFAGRAYPGRPIAPPIRTLVIAHGVTMAAWMLLYLTQSLLIATRRPRLHMKLGWAGLTLAVAVVVTGLWLTVEATRILSPGFTLFTLNGKQFTAVSMLNMVVFAGFIGFAIWQRRRPAIHRPTMMLATLSVVPAALARIDPIIELYQGTAWERWLGPFLPMLVLGGVLLLAKCLISRTFDRWMAAGLAVLAVASVAIMWIATTSAWDRFAGWVLG